ncbi:hypothetical protein ABIE32_001666 [Comamonas sp. 4034]
MVEPFTLPAGTLCKRNGIPFKLAHATQIECHPGVWPLIKGAPPDEMDEPFDAPGPHPAAPDCSSAVLEFSEP